MYTELLHSILWTHINNHSTSIPLMFFMVGYCYLLKATLQVKLNHFLQASLVYRKNGKNPFFDNVCMRQIKDHSHYFELMDYPVSLPEAEALRESIMNETLLLALLHFPNFLKCQQNSCNITSIMQEIVHNDDSKSYLSPSLKFLFKVIPDIEAAVAHLDVGELKSAKDVCCVLDLVDIKLPSTTNTKALMQHLASTNKELFDDLTSRNECGCDILFLKRLDLDKSKASIK